MTKRVLFDASPMLDAKKTGIGYYVEQLMYSLQTEYGDKLEMTGYYFNFLKRKQKEPKASPIRFCAIWLVPGKLLALSRRFGFQPFLDFFLRPKADLVLFTNYVSLPLFHKRKTALIIYDMGFLDVPESLQNVNLRFMRRFCPPSIKRADVIITISEFTKQRLLHHFPDLKADIVVTPIPPVQAKTDYVELPRTLISQGIAAKKYLLYLGTVEPRKNLEGLIAAYALLDKQVQSEYALVIAGGRGWKDENILAAASKAKADGLAVILPGYVSELEKLALYSNAACFVLPSHYEGFGMPIYEAMQHNIPVAVSDIAVFHEVADDSVAYFNQDNPGDIARTLENLLSSPEHQRQLITKASRQVKKFKWDINAKLVYNALVSSIDN